MQRLRPRDIVISSVEIHVVVSATLFCTDRFLFYEFADNQDLHSFPTRRSSDLKAGAPVYSHPAIGLDGAAVRHVAAAPGDRKSTRLNSSDLGSSSAVLCLKEDTGRGKEVRGAVADSHHVGADRGEEARDAAADG